MLWKATSRHQEQLLSSYFKQLASVATSQQTRMAGKWPFSELLFRPFSTLPASAFTWLSAHHLHLNTQKPFCSAQQALAFFFWNTSYLPVQKVTAIHSIDVVFSFDFNGSDAQLPLFPPLWPSVLEHSYNHFQDAEEVVVVAAEPLFVCLFFYLALNLMTVESGS